MADSKGFSDRVEQWLAKIPGIRTYRDREHRRETDKRIREHLAERLEEIRFQLKNAVLEINRGNPLHPVLSDLDRLSSRVQQVGDTIRYASYGYAGIFDLEKIREEELGRLYDFDLSLMDEVNRVQAQVKGLDPKAPPDRLRAALAESSGLLDGLEMKFRRRHDFMMNKPV